MRAAFLVPVAVLLWIAAATGGSASGAPTCVEGPTSASDRTPTFFVHHGSSNVREELGMPASHLEKLAWGRRAYPEAVEAQEVHLTFRAANPANPISYPFDVGAESGFDNLPAIHFARGNGPGELIWIWSPLFAEQGCREELSQVIQPWHGRDPQIQIGRRGKQATFLPVLRDLRGPCRFEATVGVLSATFGRGNDKRQFLRRDTCRGRFLPTFQGGNNWFAGSSRFSGISLTPNFYSNGRHILPFQFDFTGKQITQGEIHVLTKIGHERRIWEGTDAFVNHCINGAKTIYSENHRLYCYAGGRSSERITRITSR
jgi:hypothetical protein